MHTNRLLLAATFAAGLASLHPATAASPLVIVNQGLQNSCTITPNNGTVFSIAPSGDVLINGSYTSGACGQTQSSGNPSFSPFSPAPANLTIPNGSLPSTGGTVTPNFTVYYANTCTGKVTATAGCNAVPAPWGTGGVVCSGVQNATGQTYCSPGNATVAMPPNPSATTVCSYTFQAINCTNGSSTVDSQTAVVTVDKQGSTGATCNTTDPTDLPGYTRQCGGTATNYKGTTTWDNTYASLFNGAWPGNTSQAGHPWTVTLNKTAYASFKIQTGSVQGGVHLYQNNTFGQTPLMSISTTPGNFVNNTVCPAGSSLFISSVTGTTAACKLSLNSTYYLNISLAILAPPDYPSSCDSTACTIGGSFDFQP